MTLDQDFLAYLCHRQMDSQHHAMQRALRQSGFTWEASVWEAGPGWTRSPESGAPWDGQRVWVGERPPGDALPGELWFDTVELNTMLLVPWGPHKADQGYCWMSTQQVHRWQWGAFLHGARLEASTPPPVPLQDPERAPASPASALASGLCHEEARLYASWFGKLLSDAIDWEFLAQWSEAHVTWMWGPQPREWSQELRDSDDDLRVIRTPWTLETDIEEAYEQTFEENEPPPERERILYPRWHVDHDAGLRTVVNLQLGLQHQGHKLRRSQHQLQQRLPRSPEVP